MPRRWKTFILVGIATAVADQLTKWWANGLPTDGHGRGIPVSVIENFWDWRLSKNPGSAFSLMAGVSGAQIILTVVGLIALGFIIWMLRQADERQRRLHWALGLVAGGAIGNLIDRIAYGEVTDFIVWRYYQKEWPTFNVADVALVIGVGLLFLDFGRQHKDEKAATDADANGGAAGKKSRGKGKKPKKR